MSLFLTDVVGLEYLAVLLVWAAIVPVLLLTLSAMAGTFHGVLRHRQSPRRAVLYGVGLTGLLLPGALALLGKEGLNVFTLSYAITLVIATPLFIALVARHWGKEIRKDQETLSRLDQWEGIELSDG